MKNLFVFILLFTGFMSNAQQTDYVDFKTAKAHVIFGDLAKKEVLGNVIYKFTILKNIDSIVIDAKKFSKVKYILNRKNEDSVYNGKQIIIKYPFKAKTNHEVIVGWEVQPKKAMYFIDWEYENGNKQVWTQGQGKYTSNWLPSFDDMNEKVEFDVDITFVNGYEVTANGELANKQIDEATTTWSYNMQKPMSSYLLALVIGKYDKKVEYSKRGIPLEMYYYPEDSLKVESTYRYTKHMFDFLEEEIGVPYPWQNYKQVPVKDFLYAGMENTSTTIFSDAFVVDSIAFVDKNYVNVNAHELAHQWFGDLVTEASGTHHWLQEGFATYYALLAEKEVFGEDYYYWRLYEYAQELLAQDKAGQSTSLLNPKSSSVTFYKKGAWVLHVLREKVGDEAFRKGVKGYLLKYQFKNVETDDFILEVEKASGMDLSEFSENWLYTKSLHYDELMKTLSLASLKYEDFLQLNCKEGVEQCLKYLKTSTDPHINSEILKKIKGNIPKAFFESKDLKFRQAIAQAFNKIPTKLKKGYESLLDDESYVTIETALFNLWNNFPDDQYKYLDKTKGIIGFNDKNIRILWLTLALITDDYEPENNEKYFKELEGYTSPKYGFETRQNAFSYLKHISSCVGKCKENLDQATSHHNWRFSKFAKELLKVK